MTGDQKPATWADVWREISDPFTLETLLLVVGAFVVFGAILVEVVFYVALY